jgi:predicted MFS family arabinose efflux permease
MAAAMGVGRFAYTPLLPQMQQTFGWSFSEAGDVASANYLGYMIGALLAARAVGGPRALQWLGLSLIASVISIYLGVLVDSFAAWIAVRLFSGIASAYCLVLTTTMLGQLLITTQQTRLANLHFTGVGLGIVLTVLITWPGGSVSSQWQNLAGLSAVLMALAWFAFRSGEPGIEIPRPAESGWIPSVGMWRLVLGYGCFGFGYVVTATFIVAMAHDVDVSRNAERSVWLLVGLAVIPSVYVWQKLAERAGVLTALRWAYLVEAVGVLVAGWFSSAAALVAGGVLLGGTFAAITALGLSAARQYAGQDPAGAIGRMTAAFALGQLIGPAVSGRLAEGFGGFAAPSLVASSLLVLGYLLLWRFPEPAVS